MCEQMDLKREATFERVEELWTPPRQSPETEVFPSLLLLAGVWNDERRATAIEWLDRQT